jgi:hypothetical protein
MLETVYGTHIYDESGVAIALDLITIVNDSSTTSELTCGTLGLCRKLEYAKCKKKQYCEPFHPKIVIFAKIQNNDEFQSNIL